MPRKTKEIAENDVNKPSTTKKTSSTKKTTTAKKASTAKKSTSTKKASTSKAVATKKTTTSKTTSAKKVAKDEKTTTAKKTTAIKATKTKKTDTAKATKTKKADTAKATTKATSTKTATAKKSTPVKKDSTEKKATTTKKTTATKKATATKKKEASTKKTTRVQKKATTTKKKAATTKRVSKAKKDVEILDRQFSAEYYDLPFRYNQTVVKILAQTPKNLFIYWEISDEDRKNLKNQYGEYFFEITKPVLVVHNETLNYSFEVDIDDFANSWYLHVNDSNSEYKIELGRRPIPVNYNYIPNYDIQKNGPIEEIKTPYIYISSSNELDAPNDRILYNKIQKVYFRNVKTNELIERDISDFPSIYKDGIFINIYKLYQELYKEEIKNDSFNLLNPSSGNVGSGSFSSRFY